MKIKRFYAATLREALQQVKQELGSDAVILSNNKGESGIELVAAIDYDEKKVANPASTKTTYNKNKSAKPTVQPLSEPKTETKNPDWLRELKKSAASTTMSSNNKQHAQDIEDHLKGDVVSFSKLKQEKNSKKDPHISEARVNSVVDKDVFSNILEKQKDDYSTGVKGKLSTTYHSENNQQDDLDAFNYDAVVSENKETVNNETYSKPTIKPQKASVKQNQESIEWSQDPMLVSMKEEIQSLKDLLQNQMSGLAWGNFNRNNPHRSELLQRFYKLGLKPSISETILRQINEPSSLEDGWKKGLSLISRGIKVAETDILKEGGMIALVGPTGVGKTTSIAKLASRFTLQYGSSDMALVSTDSYRVGAQEQLKTYGQLLRVPVYIAANEKELGAILDRLKDKRLVLIDTAGMNQRDIRMTEQLSMLKNANKKIKLISVLSASAQSSAIHEVASVLKPYGMDGCIVSKLDESTSLGGIISVIIEQQLPLQYVTDGQKVPEDIHPGRVSHLLKRAMGIVRERKDAYDYNDIALSFAGDLLQANG
jgi:flagellar biosynthesis protein FlhF